MQSLLRALAVAIAGFVFTTSPAAALPIVWGGALGSPPSSGTDPFGHTWQLTEGPPLVWGIPGHSMGEVVWAGPFTLTSFEITFFGGSLISTSLDPTDANSTRFRQNSGGPSAAWNASLSADRHTALFTAVPGAELDPGEFFFVNVVFENPLDVPVSFTGVYDGASSTPVPEPGSYGLVAAGLVAFAVVRRRRRA